MREGARVVPFAAAARPTTDPPHSACMSRTRSAPRAPRAPRPTPAFTPLIVDGGRAAPAPALVTATGAPLSAVAPTPAFASLRLADLLAAMSHALDLTEGQPEGHTVRSALIGMRLADELGLDASTRFALYYALLLKDAGCSSNAARMAALFGGDDRDVKPRMKLVDWHRRVGLAIQTFRTVAPRGSVADKVRHFLGIASTSNVTRDLIGIRCDRGAEIAAGLGFPAESCEAIRSLDEHWCGMGYPQGLSGEAIPLLARIANLAQAVESYHARWGLDAAIRMVRARSGRWFDPALASRVITWKGDREWWRRLAAPDAMDRLLALEPPGHERHIDEGELDRVARSFASIVDAKSPYTHRHSVLVASYALAIGETLGLPDDEMRRLGRAGLLHDVGKLGVSNAILDKPGGLAPEERQTMERHPLHTWEILSRVRAFSSFARTAALHHEKIDGTGYPWRVPGDRLPDAARVLTVADIVEALTADRPYRTGMPIDQVMGILRREQGVKLCRRAVEAFEASVESGRLEIGVDTTAAA